MMGCSNGGGGGGGVGKYGEGMENKSTGVTVLSSHPLTEEIDKGGGYFANEIMNTRDAMEREYGDAVSQMSLHVGTFSDRTVLGAYGGNVLTMNQKYIRTLI